MNKVVFLIICALVVSCQSASPELQQVKDQVMKVHDEVMPLMGELSKVRRRLKQQADSLPSDAMHRRMLMQQVGRIEKANDQMMQWMRNYEVGFGNDVKAQLDYQKKQLEEIQAIADDMKKALSEGAELVKE